MYNMYNVIEKLCQSNGIKVGKMCSDLNISRGIMSDLKAGRTQKLSAQNLQKISDYFSVSSDYILGKETASPVNKEYSIDPDIRRIERARKNMSDADKQKMMNILKASFEDYFSDDYIDDDLDE